MNKFIIFRVLGAENILCVPLLHIQSITFINCIAVHRVFNFEVPLNFNKVQQLSHAKGKKSSLKITQEEFERFLLYTGT